MKKILIFIVYLIITFIMLNGLFCMAINDYSDYGKYSVVAFLIIGLFISIISLVVNPLFKKD